MIVFLLSDNILRFITDHQHGQTTVQDLWEQGNANIDAGFRRCRKNKYPFVERSIDVYVVWIATACVALLGTFWGNYKM